MNIYRGMAGDYGMYRVMGEGQSEGAAAGLHITVTVATDPLGFARQFVERAARASASSCARELEALDDRILNDIGLTRASIPYVIDRVLTGIGGAGTTLIQATRDARSKDGYIAVGCEEETLPRAA